MMTESTVTIFNRCIDRDTDKSTFYRTVFPAHWEECKGKNNSTASGTNQNSANEADVFVPFYIQDEIKKTYVTPDEFAAMTDIDRRQHFTFAPEDIMYNGEITAEIPENGLRAFLREHPGEMVVKTVETFRFGSFTMQHWEVHCSE